MTGRTINARAGAILLETVIAVAMLTMAAITILGAVNQGVVVMERSRMALRASDLARSAMAEIEAGISTPESLLGPVPQAEPSKSEDGEPATEFQDSLPPESGWELDISVAPSPFAGLSVVSVRAFTERAGSAAASYTLVQLVRLGGDEPDQAGREGELLRESERGLRSRDSRGATPGQPPERGPDPERSP